MKATVGIGKSHIQTLIKKIQCEAPNASSVSPFRPRPVDWVVRPAPCRIRFRHEPFLSIGPRTTLFGLSFWNTSEQRRGSDGGPSLSLFFNGTETVIDGDLAEDSWGRRYFAAMYLLSRGVFQAMRIWQFVARRLLRILPQLLSRAKYAQAL